MEIPEWVKELGQPLTKTEAAVALDAVGCNRLADLISTVGDDAMIEIMAEVEAHKAEVSGIMFRMLRTML